MKSALLVVASITIAASVYAEPAEEKLANLQIEKAGLLTKFRSDNPRIKILDVQILTLSKSPDIFNQKYYTILKDKLISLKSEQAKLLFNCRSNNPAVSPVRAEIFFIEETLKDNAG